MSSFSVGLLMKRVDAFQGGLVRSGDLLESSCHFDVLGVSRIGAKGWRRVCHSVPIYALDCPSCPRPAHTHSCLDSRRIRLVHGLEESLGDSMSIANRCSWNKLKRSKKKRGGCELLHVNIKRFLTLTLKMQEHSEKCFVRVIRNEVNRRLTAPRYRFLAQPNRRKRSRAVEDLEGRAFSVRPEISE